MGPVMTAPGAIIAPGGQAGVQVGVHTGVHIGAGCTQTGSGFLRQQQPTSPRPKARIARVAGILVSFMELSKFGGEGRVRGRGEGGRGRGSREGGWGWKADGRYSLFNSTRRMESGADGR